MNKYNNYWRCLDSKLEELLHNGYCFLPSILDVIDRDKVSDEIMSEISSKVYTSNLKSHLSFCDNFGITNILASKLFEFASEHCNYKGLISDQYHIARKVKPGLSSEAYRGHFDSHCFTLVTPITIPKKINKEPSGELVFYPNIRKSPKNEIVNFFEKLSYKRFASKEGFNQLSQKKVSFVADFQDYRPLLFIGNRTLHGNLPVSQVSPSERLTLLSHFFDPSPSWGIGNLLRKVRNR